MSATRRPALSPIVITGGGQRLGLATARALRRQDYDVVVTYRRFRPVIRELQSLGVETIEADFGDEAGAIGFADALRSRYQSIRGLIHNASEWLPESEDRCDASVMRSMLNVHVMAPYLINQRCGELLVRYGEAHGHADIIHMTDYVASIGSRKHIAYAASKAALDNLTLLTLT